MHPGAEPSSITHLSRAQCAQLPRFWAPANAPREIIAKLNAATVEALADPSVRQRFAEIGQDIFPVEQQTPQALAALQGSEIEKWWQRHQGANIKLSELHAQHRAFSGARRRTPLHLLRGKAARP